MLGWLLILAQPSYAEDSAAFEKIRDVSPDGKFALRISCSGKPEDTNDIDSSLITAVELVSLPSKKGLVICGKDYEGNLVWSQDSEWFAFPLSDGHRITYTHVYHRSGDDFAEVKTEELRVDVEGDVRNEYVKPIRWIKHGVLLLEQFDIFRGAEDGTYQFTARLDEKTGKFQITSKKKIPSKE